MEHRSEVSNLVLQAKTDMQIPRVEVYLGDQETEVSEIQYRLAGTGYQIPTHK